MNNRWSSSKNGHRQRTSESKIHRCFYGILGCCASKVVDGDAQMDLLMIFKGLLWVCLEIENTPCSAIPMRKTMNHGIWLARFSHDRWGVALNTLIQKHMLKPRTTRSASDCRAYSRRFQEVCAWLVSCRVAMYVMYCNVNGMERNGMEWHVMYVWLYMYIYSYLLSRYLRTMRKTQF